MRQRWSLRGLGELLGQSRHGSGEFSSGEFLLGGTENLRPAMVGWTDPGVYAKGDSRTLPPVVRTREYVYIRCSIRLQYPRPLR